MIRILPFILLPVLIFAGLGFWRYQSSKNLATSQSSQKEDNSGSIEVPATLPGASIEDRVKVLEEAVTKMVGQINNFKTTSKTESNSSLEKKVSSLEGSILDLKARVSALEKATPVPSTTTSSSSKSVVYIPLGSGGGPWSNTDWYTLNEYEISLDPANYPGYTGMVLEVSFRLVESAGTGSVRLYNTSDSSVTSSQLDTTSTTYGLKTSSSFTLPSGSKTYKLQVKSSSNKDLFIQSARIKVNF